MNIDPVRLISTTLAWAEILNAIGNRIHIGCIMAAGEDWVEVSLPARTKLPSAPSVRFCPSLLTHEVSEEWRTIDRVGFTYIDGGPPVDHFAGMPGLYDPRPAALKVKALAQH